MAGKQGKTKGATSFVYVALAELNSVLRPEANVLVSRKYAETLNINYEQVSLSSNDLKREIDTKKQTDTKANAIQFNVQDLDDKTNDTNSSAIESEGTVDVKISNLDDKTNW